MVWRNRSFIGESGGQRHNMVLYLADDYGEAEADRWLFCGVWWMAGPVSEKMIYNGQKVTYEANKSMNQIRTRIAGHIFPFSDHNAIGSGLLVTGSARDISGISLNM